MARLHLFAEGMSELVFAREVLGPHLWSYGVFLHNPVLIANARKKRIVHRGGGRAFRPMQNDIEFFDNATQGIGNLQNVASRVSSPELINDGEDTAPSKRIIEQFPTYERLKATVGPQMAGLIGLHKIRAACPHFDVWVRRLEQLEKRIAVVTHGGRRLQVSSAGRVDRPATEVVAIGGSLA